EITLPSSFVNKIDAKSDRGGLLGLFFMAFSLALVSFSCTGPIIGTLLVEAASKGGAPGSSGWHAWIFYCLGGSFCSFCGLSFVAEVHAKVWRVAEQREGGFGLFGAGLGVEVFVERRLGLSLELAGPGSFSGLVDSHLRSYGALSHWQD